MFSFKSNKSNFLIGGFIVASLAILLNFQNCSNQDLSNTLTQPSSSKVDSSNLDKIPFAFDFQADQISYMSCSRTNDKKDQTDTTPAQVASITHLNDPNVFYTFKVGAYENSGLTLRPEFIDFVKSNFTFKGVLNDSEIQDAFSYGSAHGGAAIQLAIRESTPIASQIQFVESSSPTQGLSFQLLPANVLLTFKEFLPQLISLFKNPKIRLTSLGSSSLQNYRLEGAIHEESVEGYNELTAEQYRSKLQSSTSTLSSLLALTYSKDLRLSENSNSMYIARSTPSTTSDNRVWGTGFRMAFESDPRMKWKKNVISSLQEYDLSTFEPTSSTWTCPQWFRFMIVSPLDKDTPGPAFCQEVPNESVLDDNQRKILKQMRRHLNPSEWIIDPIHQCVSPKRSNLDCYGNRAFNPIDYAGRGSQCGLDSNNLYLHKDCAEFVSFCFRK